MKVNKPGYITQVDMEPFFTHDCDKCVYLGSATVNTVDVDFYVCENGSLGKPTLIYRTSSKGADYGSTPVDYVSPLSLFAIMALSLYVKHLKANGAGGDCWCKGNFFHDDTVVLKLHSHL